MGRTKEVSIDIEKQVIYNYTELKQGLQAAGRDFGLSQYMVEKILKKYGVKKRTYTEAKQEGRKYNCDDNFFKIQTSNMAYILGLIASDGSVSKKENLIAIQLIERDKNILEKINQVTKNSRPLESYVRQTGHTIVTLRVWSKVWKEDLAHYGIVPNKTFILEPPEFLAPEYRIDYIRGYFDGDGSIYRVEKQNKIFFEVSGASKKVINWIHNELINHYHVVVNKPLIETKPNGTIMYKVKIGDKDEIRRLYNLLYRDQKLFIPRKKEKFQLLLNIPRDFNSLDEE